MVRGIVRVVETRGGGVSDPKQRLAWSSGGPPPPAPAPGTPSPPAGRPKAPAPVRVRLERQGRGGKVVTLVDGLPGHPAAIEEVARALKSRCGAGGTVKGRVVEIQGDHRDKVVALLVALGFAAKRAGG
jgi:translation initiation factor 1